MNQGASTLLSYPMYCAPRHVRVLRSPRTISSHHTRVPRLRENPRQFHDLVIFQQCRSCAPIGRPLQLSYKQVNSQYTMYKHNVQPEPRQLQHASPGATPASNGNMNVARSSTRTDRRRGRSVVGPRNASGRVDNSQHRWPCDAMCAARS